ncbi:L10-interacting MYB domain-containing protein-like [Phalaenopsis equestris]|uniref:L10-interacting MYB domain-containing protein-like n=1 Tax=Phalaenopsis equestris TaxID=78828 RepID=UPI0009E55342|nr:L10-interacting MYB domain-containing protein-like [Phalaenopsis equestris]
MGNPRTGSKKKNDGAESELHAAARAGNLRAVESICSSDPIAVNFRDKHSRTPAMNKSKEVASSAMWDKDATNIFCDLCLREVELGNRPKTYFNKEGWQNVMIKFKELTGRDYDRMKFKNKWDQLKKDWKIWKKLKIGTTGLGWNPVKRTIDAHEDWWTEKLEVMPAAKKFKFNGIDPVMEEKLDGMFKGVVATRAHAFTPSEHEFIGTTNVLGTYNISGSGEVPYQIHRSVDESLVESSSITKRRKVEKKKKGAAFVRSTIEKLVESCSVKLYAS